MHDTPSKPLFKQRSRAFSATCVRVEGVFDLVDWIASYRAGLSPSRPRAPLARSWPGRRCELDTVRCRCTSSTSQPVAERDGDVEFRPDIYGRDGAVDRVREMDRDPNEPAPAVTLAP